MAPYIKKSKQDVNSSNKQSLMKSNEAAHMVDKNSRTIVKILQLIELNQRAGAQENDKDGLIIKKIEKLKVRMNRRLIKLGRWSDAPESDRYISN
jgi:phage regulator Rha-like protein